MFKFPLDTFYSPSAQPHAGPEEAGIGRWDPPQHRCDPRVLGTMRIEVWLLLPGSLPCGFCVIVCLMFIVRSVLVLDLWFSSFILCGSGTLYCKLRLLK